MSNQTNSLMATLLEAGLMYAEPPATENPESPWYVKVLLAFSGWLAAIFLLFFIGMGFHELLDSKTGLSIAGFFMIVAAVTALSRIRDNDFLEHLMLAFSMAGHVMLWVGLFADDRDVVFSYWLVAVFEAILAIFVSNTLHRIFSSSATVILLLMAMLRSGMPDMIFFPLYANAILFFAAFLFLKEFRHPQHMKKMQAIAYGFLLVIMPLYTPISILGDVANRTWFAHIPWLNALVSTAVVFYVAWQLMLRVYRSASIHCLMGISMVSICVGAFSYWMPGITIAIILIALGFASSNRMLLGLGIVSLLGFISHYYYALHATLLHKSMTLAIAGAALLMVRWIISRSQAVSSELQHAQ